MANPLVITPTGRLQAARLHCSSATARCRRHSTDARYRRRTRGCSNKLRQRYRPGTARRSGRKLDPAAMDDRPRAGRLQRRVDASPFFQASPSNESAENCTGRVPSVVQTPENTCRSTTGLPSTACRTPRYAKAQTGAGRRCGEAEPSPRRLGSRPQAGSGVILHVGLSCSASRLAAARRVERLQLLRQSRPAHKGFSLVTHPQLLGTGCTSYTVPCQMS